MPYSKEEYNMCLQGLLSDDSDLRRESAEDLGYSEISEASMELVKYLADQDKGVRDAVANSLKKLSFAPSAYPLVEYLKNQEIDIRNYASDILTSMQEKSVPALLKMLNDDDHDARKFSADILGLIKTLDSIPELIKHLDDSDPNVQVSAIEALGNLRYPESVDALIDKARRDPENMAMVLDALGKIGSDKINGFIEEAVEHDDSITAFSAIETIGQIGSKNYLPLLFSQLRKREDFFAAPILLAILKIATREKISVVDIRELLELGDDILTAAFSEEEVTEQFSLNLTTLDKQNSNPVFFLKFLNRLNKDAKLDLLSYLGSGFSESFKTVIGLLLNDKDSWIVFKTCDLISKYRITDFFATLAQIAGSGDAMLEIGAAKAFGELKSKDAIPVLEKLQKETRDEDVLKEVSAALAKIKN